MLFHTWPFLIFMLVVLPLFFVLRRWPLGPGRSAPRLWLPLLMAASYFFYGWWNPWYLLLVAYSTALDYLLVTLMDHCPRAGAEGGRDHSLAGTGGTGFQPVVSVLRHILAARKHGQASAERHKPGILARALRLQFDDP
ncbi:MAG: hypothetical protein ACHRHE_23250, partial [Tepidisphaerales bacterium]